MGDERRLPPGNQDHEATLSGLHEKQIAEQDLLELREACKLHTLLPEDEQVPDIEGRTWIKPELDSNRVHNVDLAVGVPPALWLRSAPLPRTVRVMRGKLAAQHAKCHRDLHLAISQPIRRSRMLHGELTKAMKRELYRQLYLQYGESAEQMVVQAVFAHVPSDAAKSCRTSADLRYLYFTFPADVSPRSAEEGHYLVVLRSGEGETRHALFRLKT